MNIEEKRKQFFEELKKLRLKLPSYKEAYENAIKEIEEIEALTIDPLVAEKCKKFLEKEGVWPQSA